MSGVRESTGPGTWEDRVSWFHWHQDGDAILARIRKDPDAWAAYAAWVKKTPGAIEVSVADLREQVRKEAAS